MATRTLNVLLTGDPTQMNKAFASAVKSSAGAKLAIAGAAAGAAIAVGKALYDIGSEFDDAADTIRIGTGKTGKALEGLEKSFKNVIQNVPADFEEVAKAIAGVNTRLGYTGKPLERITHQFVELSRITDSDIQGNIKAVARAFEDAAIPVGKQSEKLDELFRASQNSGASVEELGTLMAKFGSPLRQLGIGFDESLAMFAQFEKAGVNIQTMVPGLRFALKQFLVEGRDPAKALKQSFKGIEEGTISSTKALELFGQRAGADMLEAVDQGRFHLEKFEHKVVSGKDTINKAGEATKDTAERFQELGNKLKVLVAPAAEFVFNKLGQLAGALAHLNLKAFAHELGLTNRDLKDIGAAFRNVASVVAKFFGPVISITLKGIKTALQGFAQFVKGIIKTISAVMHGEWGKAWDGVKDIFKGGVKTVLGTLSAMTAPARHGTELIGKAMGRGFDAAWGAIKGTFEDGLNDVIGLVNGVIDVINVLPGVDIGHVGEVGVTSTPTGGNLGKTRSGQSSRGAQHRYSGGAITRPMAIVGEEAPTHNEWVIATNPRYRQNNIGYWMQAGHDLGVPGFALGGVLDNIGSAAKTAAEYSPAGLALKGAKGALSVGSGVLKKTLGALPTPHLPDWMGNLGGWMIGRVTDWIKNGFSEASPGKGGGAVPSGKGLMTIDGKPVAEWIAKILLFARKAGVSFQVSSGYRTDAEQTAIYNSGVRPAAVPKSLGGSGSRHEGINYPLGAVDISPGAGSLAAWLGHSRYASTLIYAGSKDPVHFSHPTGGGYAQGGRIRGYAKGGKFDASSIKHSGVLSPEEWAIAMLLAGFPAKPGVIAQGLGTIKSESGFNASSQVPGNEHEGGWALSDAFGSTSMKLDPIQSSAAALKNWRETGSFWQAWGQWEQEQSGLAGGGAHAYGPEYLALAENVVKAFKGGGGSGGGKTGSGLPAKPTKAELRAVSIGGGVPADLAGLRNTPLSPSARALPKRFKSLLRSPGITYAQKVGVGEAASSAASETADIGDDLAALKFLEDLYKSYKASLQKKIKQVRKELHGRASPAQRKKLEGQLDALLSGMGDVEGNLAGVRSGRSEAKAGRRERFAEGQDREREYQEEQSQLEAERKAEEEERKREEEERRRREPHEFWEVMMAKAEQTQGKGDDIHALEELRRVAEDELHYAESTGNLQDIADAVRNLEAATENLRNAAIAAVEEQSGGELALAELTETLSDDLVILKNQLAYAEERLAESKALGDWAEIAKWAGAVKSLTDTIKADEGAESSAQLAEELKGMREELEKQRHVGESIMATSSATYLRVIADINSGMIGAKSNHTAQLAGSGSLGTV